MEKTKEEKELEKFAQEYKDKLTNKIEEKVYNNLKKDIKIWNLKQKTIYLKEQKKY